MKKIFRALAVMLVLTMFVGVVPVSAASAKVSLRAPSKAIFVGGCKAAKANGTKASFKSYLKVTSLLTNYDSKTMTLKLTTSNKKIASVSNKTFKVTAKAPGTATIGVKVYKGTSKTPILNTSFNVTVKRNAAASDITVKGITSGSTYKVGDSVTVSLPKGKDCDKRRLTGSSNVEITSAGSNKWTVKFTKEGDFKLSAEAYYSSTYKKATASVAITGKVTEDKPAEPEKKLEVKQTNLKTFTVSGVDPKLTKNDIKLYFKEGSIEISKQSLISKFEVKDNVAEVTLFDNFEIEKEYFVAIGDAEYSFKTVNPKLENLAEVKFATEKAKVGETTTIVLKYFTSDGVDITDALSSKVLLGTNLKLEQLDGNGKGFVTGQTITFTEKNATIAVKASVTVGYNPTTMDPIVISGVGAITSYEDTVSGAHLYTVTKDDGVYMTKKDTPVHFFALGESVELEALFHFSDDSYRTFTETGYTVESANPETVMIGGLSATGGYTLLGVNQGTTNILVKNGSTLVAAFEVTVRAARAPKTFKVTASKSNLNLNPLVGDELKITAVAYDQYGDIYPGATFSVEQNENNKLATGTVSPLMFSGNTCYINGSYVTLVPNASLNSILLYVTCNEIASSPKESVLFSVKDVPFSDEVYAPGRAQMTIEGDAVIDTVLSMGIQDMKSTYVYANFMSEGYKVQEAVGDILTVDPTKTVLTSTDLGIAADTTDLFCTVSFDGQVIDPMTAGGCIIPGYDNIEFAPIAPGAKLKKGTYTVTVYKIKAGTTASQVTPLGARSINVIESVPDVTVNKLAASATATMPLTAALPSFFTFYYDGAPVNASCITSVDAVTSVPNYFIKSVTLTLPNNIYGSFTVDVPVDSLITIK